MCEIHSRTIYSVQKSQLKLHENRAVFSYHLGSTGSENLSYKPKNQPIGMKAQRERLCFIRRRLTLDYSATEETLRKKVKTSRDTNQWTLGFRKSSDSKTPRTQHAWHHY